MMMHVLNQKDSDFVYIKINGGISEDYYELIFPIFLHKAKINGMVRLVLELVDIDYPETPFILEKFGLHVEDFEKIAIVGNQKWKKWIENMSKLTLDTDILYFKEEEKEKAEKWISGNHLRFNKSVIKP
jgi:hypothetical protein